MEKLMRRSAVSFEAAAAKTQLRANWNVVLEYEAEGSGPYVIDLSHRSRWDLQDTDIAGVQPWGIAVPAAPGQSTFERGIVINRMNRSQASIWHLAGELPGSAQGAAYTQTTDATVFLALIGQEIFSIAEKLTALDFLDPQKEAPFLLQGPFSHVPCQIVTLEKTAKRSGILLTCSRGYARSMTAAILDAGDEYGLRPAGENALTRWLDELADQGPANK